MTAYEINYIDIDDDGDARIAGKGFKVYVLAALHNKGWTVEDFAEQYDLSPVQVYAGLTYYYDHKEKIDKANLEGEQQIEKEAIPLQDLIQRLKDRKK